MTIVVVALLGAGIVLIASALDNSSIVDTFHKIITNQKIDWTGGSSSTPSSSSSSLVPSTKNYPAINGACPNGGTLTTDSSGLQICKFN